MNPRAFRPPPRRRFALNPQMREDLGRFLRDGQIRIHGFRLALLVGLAFLVTWPGDPVLDMVKGGLAYASVGVVTLLLTAYLGVIQGIRLRAGGGAHGVGEWAAFVPLGINRYLRGTFAGRMGDVLFFLGLAAPLLIPAAALEGAGMRQVGAGVAVLLVTAVTARMAAYYLQICLEHRPLLLHLSAHAVLVGIFVIGGLLWPPLSPILAFLSSTVGGAGYELSDWVFRPWPGILMTHGAIWAIIYGLSYLRVRGLRRADADAATA